MQYNNKICTNFFNKEAIKMVQNKMLPSSTFERKLFETYSDTKGYKHISLNHMRKMDFFLY